MTENTVPSTDTKDVTSTSNREATHEPDRFLAPAVDIYEEKDGLVVVADMPGLTQEQISISVEKDILSIKGVIHPVEDNRQYLSREFVPTSFFRQFQLGNKINQNAIAADYRHGVLRITLPFAEEVKPKTISVKVG